MGIFPVEFPTTTALRFLSLAILHYFTFIVFRSAPRAGSTTELSGGYVVVFKSNPQY